MSHRAPYETSSYRRHLRHLFRPGWTGRQKPKPHLSAAIGLRPSDARYAWWLAEALRRVSAIRACSAIIFLGCFRNSSRSARRSKLPTSTRKSTQSIDDAILFAEKLINRIDRARNALAANPAQSNLAEQLRESLLLALENLQALAASLRAIEQTASALPTKRISRSLSFRAATFSRSGMTQGRARSIGSCYDLFASEARLATFLAVARGDLPQRSWFKLDREHAYAYGRFLPFPGPERCSNISCLASGCAIIAAR